MKPKLLAIALLFLLSLAAFAAPRINIGMSMGAFGPDTDSTTLRTFGNDFFLNGYLGLENESGLEMQASLGTYSNVSHHPDNLATNFTLNIVPLKAALLYHFFQGSEFRPYVGASGGAYFYNLHDDDPYGGNIARGTVFGYSLLAGLQVHFTNYIYVTAQAEKYFLPKIFFTDAKNFDSASFTVGVGLVTNFLKVGGYNVTQSGVQYQYTRDEENLLVEIQQVKQEQAEIKIKLQQIEDDMDEFYLNDFIEQDPSFNIKYSRIKYLEAKQQRLDLQRSQAQARLDALTQRWDQLRKDTRPVEDHLVYVETNYSRSPYGLRYRNGYLLYDNGPYRYHYYEDVNLFPPPVFVIPGGGSGTAPTPEERAEFLKKKKEHIEQLKGQ